MSKYRRQKSCGTRLHSASGHQGEAVANARLASVLENRPSAAAEHFSSESLHAGPDFRACRNQVRACAGVSIVISKPSSVGRTGPFHWPVNVFSRFKSNRHKPLDFRLIMTIVRPLFDERPYEWPLHRLHARPRSPWRLPSQSGISWRLQRRLKARQHLFHWTFRSPGKIDRADRKKSGTLPT